MYRKNKINTVVAIAIALVFIMPGAAVVNGNEQNDNDIEMEIKGGFHILFTVENQREIPVNTTSIITSRGEELFRQDDVINPDTIKFILFKNFGRGIGHMIMPLKATLTVGERTITKSGYKIFLFIILF